MTREEIKAAIAQLRGEGCAVVVFNADELMGADPRTLEDQMVGYGYDVIEGVVRYDMENWPGVTP